jgi:hypothetical protein
VRGARAHIAGLLGLPIEPHAAEGARDGGDAQGEAGGVGIHISLSRPFPLRHVDREAALAALAVVVRGAARSTGSAGALSAAVCAPFRATLDAPALFLNDACSRAFAAALVGEGADAIVRLIDAASGALGAFGAPG